MDLPEPLWSSPAKTLPDLTPSVLCQESDRLSDVSVGSHGSQLERPTVDEADGRYDNQDEAGVNVHKLSSINGSTPKKIET